MSSYVKATNFATKDTLPTGDSNKIVKGTEIDNEFNAIAGAISSKSDIASPSFTGTPAVPTATLGSNTTQIANTAFVAAALTDNATASVTLTNKTLNLTSNTLTGTLAQFNTACSNADFVSLAGTETLTNKTLTSPSISNPAITGVPTAPTASTGTNTTQLATTAFVNASILYAVPVGVITLWSGAIASIPAGWALCNGSSGTPDLRDRFVVGAGTTYSVGAIGGSNTVTLDATMIPSHTHTVTTTGTASSENAHSHTFSGTTSGQSASHTHTATVTDPGHTHTSPSNGAPNGGGAGAAFTAGMSNTPGQTTLSNTTGITVTNGNASADHTHTYSGTTSTAAAHTHTLTLSSTAASTGGGLAHENRPPYYALAFIMKT